MPLKSKHILCLTFPHYGHIIPSLQLARRLADFHQVTFAVSAARLPELEQRHLITPHVKSTNFNLFGLADGLSLAECGAFKSSTYLKRIIEASGEALAKVLDNNESPGLSGLDCPVDTVIVDCFHYTAAKVSHERGIPLFFFDTTSAGLTGTFLSINEDTECTENQTTEDVVFFEKPQPGRRPAPIAAGIKDLLLKMKNVAALAQGVIFNSTREMDAEVLALIEKHPLLNKQKLRFIGPLLLTENSEKKNEVQKTSKSSIEKWLDEREKASVIYVSFGSLASPAPDELLELGLALLRLDKPFILALSDKNQAHLPSQMKNEKLSGIFCTFLFSKKCLNSNVIYDLY